MKEHYTNQELVRVLTNMLSIMEEAAARERYTKKHFVGNRPSFAHSTQRKKGSWNYIPASPYQFLNMLSVVNEDAGKKLPFFEFGCGVAFKSFLASQLGHPAIGFELDPVLVRKSQKMFCFEWFNFKPEHIKQKNILELSSADIGTKPMIAYYYQPMCDQKMENDFEHLLESLMPIGSYLMPIMKMDYNSVRNSSWSRFQSADSIYKKIA